MKTVKLLKPFDIFCFTFVFILPLISSSKGYEATKVILILLFSILVSVFLIRKSLKEKLKIYIEDRLFLLWIISLAFSSIVGILPEVSFLGLGPRFQGVIFFVSLFIFSLGVKSLFPTKLSVYLVRVACVSVFIQAVIIIIQFIFRMPAIGTFGERNAVAGFLAIGAFSVFAFKNSITRYVFIFTLILAIATTNSRSGVLAVTCGFLVYVFTSKIKTKFKVIILGIVIVVGLFLAPFALSKKPAKFENRATLWQYSFDYIADRPIFGYGLDTSQILFEFSYAKDEMPLYNIVIDRSHNLILDILIWGGIFSLVTFAAWIFSVLRNRLQKKQYLLISVIVTFLAFSMFQPLSSAHWMVLILLLSISNLNKNHQSVKIN